jgi:Ser/Thr protein kinase RdoA (MazF antagonist)
MTGEYAPEVVADLETMVRRGLHRWDLPPDTAIDLLNLSENATFALRDPTNGHEWVLRVHRVGYSSAQEIRSELAWMTALRRDGVIETAQPLRAVDGAWVQTLESPSGRPARHAVAFERLPGQEPNAASDAPHWFERLGELTACMHRHARSWTLPAEFRRKRWDVGAMVGPNGYCTRPGRRGHAGSRTGGGIHRAAGRTLRRRARALRTGACGPAPRESAGRRRPAAHHRFR